MSKFQPPSFKTVAVVWQGRTFLASPLYMYRLGGTFFATQRYFSMSMLFHIRGPLLKEGNSVAIVVKRDAVL